MPIRAMTGLNMNRRLRTRERSSFRTANCSIRLPTAS